MLLTAPPRVSQFVEIANNASTNRCFKYKPTNLESTAPKQLFYVALTLQAIVHLPELQPTQNSTYALEPSEILKTSQSKPVYPASPVSPSMKPQ